MPFQVRSCRCRVIRIVKDIEVVPHGILVVITAFTQRAIAGLGTIISSVENAEGSRGLTRRPASFLTNDSTLFELISCNPIFVCLYFYLVLVQKPSKKGTQRTQRSAEIAEK